MDQGLAVVVACRLGAGGIGIRDLHGVQGLSDGRGGLLGRTEDLVKRLLSGHIKHFRKGFVGPVSAFSKERGQGF